MKIAARRFLVSGRVQGVGYRNFAQKAGHELKLHGSVRNLPDGSVECIAFGPPEKLDRLERRLRQGPWLARVQAVDISEAPLDASIEGFHIL